MTKIQDLSALHLLWQIDKINNKDQCSFNGCNSPIIDTKTGCCSYHANFSRKSSEGIKLNPSNNRVENYIYFILSEEVSRVKIGRSSSPETRMNEMQTGSPTKLLLICEIELPMKYEGILHEFFKDDRSHGEWFEYSEDIKTFICMVQEKGGGSVVRFFNENYGANADE